MEYKEERKQLLCRGERALFGSRELKLTDCVFADGESPLKESRDLALSGCLFRWKYPLWYCKNVAAEGCTWFEGARAGMWYTDGISVARSVMQAPKLFRRCRGVRLEDVTFTAAAETLWSCRDVTMKNVTARGDYFAMNCENLDVDGLTLDGNYGFDGVRNMTVRNSRLLTKDAFWNTENVTVYDSFIAGEYLGWNSKNLTLINCTIESLQGLCYIENLVLKNCKLIQTTYAFEYATVDAEVAGRVDSVLNPAAGTLRAAEIGDLILEPDKIDPAKTSIDCPRVERRPERPEW